MMSRRNFAVFVFLAAVFFPTQAQSALPLANLRDSYDAAKAAYAERISFIEPFDIEDGESPREAGHSSWKDWFASSRESNSRLRGETASVSAAKADLDLAKSRYFPTIDLSSSAALLGNPMEPIKIKSGALGELGGMALPPSDVVMVAGMEPTYYEFSLTLNQALFTGGKLPKGVSLAETGLSLAALNRERAEKELEAEIRGTFEALGCLVPLDHVLELQEAAGARLLVLTEKAASQGFITKAALLDAKISLQKISISKIEVAMRTERLLSRLAEVAGRDSVDLSLLDLPRPAAGLPARPREDFLALIPQSRAVKLLDGMVMAKEKLLDLSRAKQSSVPDLGLSAELKYSGPRFPFVETDWFRKDDWQLTLGIGTKNALFDVSKAGDTAKALAERESAVGQREGAERSLAALVRETWLDLELARKRLEYSILRLEGSGEKIANAKLLQDSGSGAEQDVLREMIEALGIMAEGYGTLAEYRGALLKLETATAK